MKVLIACEESQVVCNAFRARGHEAYSCDIQKCSGGHPEWHIHGDAIGLLNGDRRFYTQDGSYHIIRGQWDLIIAHPPCTHLAVSGAQYFKVKQKDGRQKSGIEFFLSFTRANCARIAIENPVGIMSRIYRKPDQIIQPYEYGHPYIKRTCLWLKGLPLLIPTNILTKPSTGWENQCFTAGRYSGFNGSFRDPKARSKTFPGIAEAMAEQWSI